MLDSSVVSLWLSADGDDDDWDSSTLLLENVMNPASNEVVWASMASLRSPKRLTAPRFARFGGRPLRNL